jgi:Cytochrome c1
MMSCKIAFKVHGSRGQSAKHFLALVVMVLGCWTTAGQAEGTHGDTMAKLPPQNTWSFSGPFGAFDRAALQRGFQVYKEVCAGCHSVKHLRYEKLQALGFSKAEIKAIAASAEVPGPLNDDGEPTTKPAEPADYFARPYPNEKAARAANNGAYPVDLSLITKARKYGADYVVALLTGFAQAPKNFHLMPGMYYNPYFEGHQIAMAPPLAEGLVTYSDGTPATVEQMAHDVVTFLAWVSEPELEERKRLGIKVLIFLSFFTLLLFILMRRTWRGIK